MMAIGIKSRELARRNASDTNLLPEFMKNSTPTPLSIWENSMVHQSIHWLTSCYPCESSPLMDHQQFYYMQNYHDSKLKSWLAPEDVVKERSGMRGDDEENNGLINT